MKKLSLLLATVFICIAATAQDSTRVDTIRVGNILIIKKKGTGDNRRGWDSTSIKLGRKQKNKLSNVTTNWWIVDLGFSGFNDNTNYGSLPTGYLANRAPTLGANDFKLRTGKSANVNIWFFMQRLNLAKHYVNLQYGLGLELNNYRFKSNISFKESGPYLPYTATTGSYIIRDSIAFSKNKLAADYITVPLMLNFKTNPIYKNRGLSLSAGVSAGYLYSQRNKQKSAERGKDKNKGDYDMERFKFSYVAELGLGPVRLYGSYSPKSMFNTGLDLKPFNVGLRLSNW